MLKTNLFEIFAVVTIISLAIALRLNGLLNQSFWYDEAYTGIMVSFDWKTLNQQLLFDVHPPVYLYLLKIYSFILPTSDFSLRIFSVFWGIAIIPLAYLVGKNINSKAKISSGLVFALLMAINPFFVLYSQEARSYTLVSFLYLLLIYVYLKAKDSAYKYSLQWQMFSGISAILFLTHYISILGIFSIVLFDLLNKPNSKNYFVHVLKKVALYIQIYAIPLLFLIPYVFFILKVQYQNSPIQWWIPFVGPEKIYESLYGFTFGVNVKSLGVPAYLNLPFAIKFQSVGFIFYTLFVIMITKIYSSISQTGKQKINFLLSISVLPIAITMIAQLSNSRLYVERYLMAFAVGIMALLAFVLSKTKKLVFLTTISIYVYISFAILFQQQQIRTSGIKSIYEMVMTIAPEKSIVIFEDPIDFITAKYYFSTKKINIKINNTANSKDNYKDWELIADNEVLNKYIELKGKQRIFVSRKDTRSDIWYVDQIKVGDYYVYSTTKIPREMTFAY